MKKIGLIGGVGWRSTAEYYRLINEDVALRLGGLHSARLSIESLDLEQVRRLADAGKEDELVGIYAGAARSLEASGAQLMAICSNAAHARLGRLRGMVGVPFISIVEPLCTAARASGFVRLGLLGTRETMSRPFFRDMLTGAGFDVIVPPEADQDWLHETIFGVLEQGRQTEQHRARFLALVDGLARSGAQAVVLGCTELPLLLGGAATAVPCLATTQLHAAALVQAALANTEPF